MDSNINCDFNVFPFIQLQEINLVLKELKYYSTFGMCIVECDETLLSKLLSFADLNYNFIVKIKDKINTDQIQMINKIKIHVVINQNSDLINEFKDKKKVIIQVEINTVNNIDSCINKGYQNFFFLFNQESRELIKNQFHESIKVIFSVESTRIKEIPSILSQNFLRKSYISVSFNDIPITLFYKSILEYKCISNIYLLTILNKEGILIDIVQTTDIEKVNDIIKNKIMLFNDKYYIVNKFKISNDNWSILIYIEDINIYHNSLKTWIDSDPNLGGLEYLQCILRTRQKSMDNSSYTYKLLSDPTKIITKLNEEANELVCSEMNQEIIHEAADLFYFLTLNCQYNEISFRDVEEFYFKKFDKHEESLVTANTSLTLKIAIYDSLEKGMIDKNIIYFTIKEENIYFSELLSHNNIIKFIYVSPFDLNNLISRRLVDSAVCYDYEIEEFLSQFHSFSLNRPSITSLVIFSKSIKNLEELKNINRKRRIILMTSLLNIGNKWIRKHNLKVKVVSISDNHSTYLKENICDVILIPNNSLTNTEEFFLIEVYSKYEKKLYVDINKLHILNTIQAKK